MKAQKITVIAMIAAIYIVLTYIFQFVSFAAVQFRISEALTLLPFLTPIAIPGLIIGCLLSNLLIGNFGLPDIIIGTIATAISSYLTYRSGNVFIAALPPIIVNAVMIGAMISIFYTTGQGSFIPTLIANIASVGLGQAVVCYILGVPMVSILAKLNIPMLEKNDRKSS